MRIQPTALLFSAGLLAVTVGLTACSAGTTSGRGSISGPAPVAGASPVTGESPATVSPASGGGSVPGGNSGPTSPSASCSLPITHATDAGFHVGVPSGWDVSTLNGQIIVGDNANDDEATLIHPARLTGGLTAASYFSTYLSGLDQANAKAGFPVSTTPIGAVDGEPAVAFTQNVNGTQLRGEATVRVLPLVAPGSTQEAAFVSWWAPADRFGSDSGQLSAIAQCYGPDPAGLFRVFRDQVFTYALPPGWAPTDENSNGIDLHGPDGSDVSYLLAGPAPTSEFDSPPSMINWFLNGVGITGVSALTTSDAPSSAAANGGTQSDRYEQFTGQSGGATVRGMIFGYTVSGGGIASGYIRMAVAPAAEWDAQNAAMIQIVGSIQHDFTQDLQMLQQVNRQWQDFSGQVADFDDVLNSQQLVLDSSTGVYYEAPYSAYDPSGPQGPGYYLPNGQPLQPVSR